MTYIERIKAPKVVFLEKMGSNIAMALPVIVRMAEIPSIKVLDHTYVYIFEAQ